MEYKKNGNSEKGKYEFSPDCQQFPNTCNMDVIANKVTNPMWGEIMDPKAYGSDSDKRRYNMMSQINTFKRLKGRIDDKLMCHMLQEPLYVGDGQYGPGCTLYVRRHSNQDYTMYQCVYNATTGRLYVRGHYRFNMNSPWYTILLYPR